MGLDMYLSGRKHRWQSFDAPESDLKEDGFRVEEIRLALGYWRKHPNLHGFIVEAFAEGKDECQDIELDPTAIRCIIRAIEDARLPHTEGFFFGRSDTSNEQAQRDVEIFGRALAWLESGEKMPPLKETPIAAGMATMVEIKPDLKWPRETRSVVYRASW